MNARISSARSLELAMYRAGGFVGAQTQECRVPQAAFGGPFHESDLSDQFGPGPYEVAHLLGCNPAAPSRPAGRKVSERALLRAKRLQMATKLAADVWGETRADLSGELELLALDGPNYQRIDAASAVRPESADHELLLILQLQLLPIARPFGGLIHRAPPLCDHALESE